MKHEDIIEILDNASIATLSESELKNVQAHALECASCRSAYEAAQLSTLVLKSRAQAMVDPSPFFQTRVMAAWREQQAKENVSSLLRLWQSARVLVSSMALATALLGAMSFLLPVPATNADELAASAYSAEAVIMGQSADEQLTYEQVLNTIYEDDDEAR